MSYKVIGAAAVVELDDGNSDIGTGRRVYLEQNAAVPENAKKAHLDHLVKVGLVSDKEGATADDVDGPDGEIPPKSATKDVWVAYAVSKGATQADADAATKEDLIAAYGS